MDRINNGSDSLAERLHEELEVIHTVDTAEHIIYQTDVHLHQIQLYPDYHHEAFGIKLYQW